MNKYWNKNTNSITPYTPGEQPQGTSKIIKLNTNENPYGPSERVTEALRTFETEQLRKYPNPEGREALKALSGYLNVPEKNIFAGNGSDEVLAFCFKTFFDSEKKVIFPDITYSFYSVYCDLFGITYDIVPLREDFYPDVDEMCLREGGVVIANPNAPTSLFMSLDDVRRILKAHRNEVVIIDEAYVEFGGESAVGLINEYDNLLVIRTMSKSYSLAGLRVGFAIGNENLIEGLYAVKNSFNSYPVDMLAGRLAAAAIYDGKYHEETIKKVLKTREESAKALEKLGFKVLNSCTNFLFVTNPKVNAAEYFNYLKKNDILVRYFPKPRIDGYLRITVGTDAEMKILLEKTEEFLNEKS